MGELKIKKEKLKIKLEARSWKLEAGRNEDFKLNFKMEHLVDWRVAMTKMNDKYRILNNE